MRGGVFEAPGLAVRQRAEPALGEVQEPRGDSGDARVGGGMGKQVKMTNEKQWRISDLLADLTFVGHDAAQHGGDGP